MGTAKKDRRGRRARPEDLEDFVHLLGRGMSFSDASAQVGFSKQAMYQRMKRDPAFCARVEQARASVESKIEGFLVNLRAGASISTAAPAAALSRNQIYRRIQRDAMFRDEVEAARSVPDTAVQRVLLKKALGGDVKAMAVWLKCRRPAEWSDVGARR